MSILTSNLKGSVMKRAQSLSALFLSMAVAAAMTGCRSAPSDAPVAVVADYAVVVDTPVVRIDHGVTSITGTLHRQPGNTDEITGRLDIEFIASDGDVLDGLPCRFVPRKLPTDPGATASYSINYGWVPPAGTTVRVKFVDSATAEREDAENGGPGSANSAASGATGGHGTGGAHVPNAGAGGSMFRGGRGW